MSVSLYCSPTQLLLLVGTASGQRATVDEFQVIPLPEQSMINGVITNKDAMARFFQAVSQQFGPYGQDAVLVLESNNIRTKIMTLPRVRERKLLDFVRQDFGEISEEGGDVFDFTVLGPNHAEGGIEVLGIAAGKLLLQNYIDVLQGAGFKLKRIDVGSNALRKIARFIPQLQSSNSVLVHIDDMSLAITLFEQGNYRISQRYRLLNPPNTEERQREVSSNISSMVQFQKSQRRDITINAIYVLGMPSPSLPAFIEATRFLEIPVEGLSLDSQIKLTGKANFDQAHFDSSKFLYNLGAMIRK
ncbi:MAG: pilus assembly protein PilM [Coriobacteriales bacterium]|jgi:Tfp pilus assembly PilM family ATPase|nr:pilus assembly protein PilM [Coriobacteriales bacterium]